MSLSCRILDKVKCWPNFFIELSTYLQRIMLKGIFLIKICLLGSELKHCSQSLFSIITTLPFLERAITGLFKFTFCLFQTNRIFYNKLMWKYPFSIWCWDSKSQTFEHKSPNITTRLRLPPVVQKCLSLKAIKAVCKYYIVMLKSICVGPKVCKQIYQSNY